MAWASKNLPIFVALALSLLASVTRAFAEEPALPVVIVLQTATDPAGMERDRRFTEELGLALDGFMVSAQVADPSFAGAALSEQLTRVRALGTNTQVAATLWLRAADSVVLLHLVALQTQRALVRIIEAAQRPALEAELALVAKELLGEAYLFARQAEVAAPVGAVVNSVRSSTRDTTPPRLEVGAFGEAGTGLSGAVGPSAQAGGGFALGVRVWRAGFLLAAGHGLTGPRGQTSRAQLRGAELGASLGLSYRFDVRAFELGPVARASLSQRRLDTRTDTGAERDLRTVSARLAAGGEAALVRGGTRLWLELTGGARLFKTALRARSDRATLSRTPDVDMALRLGLSVGFR